MINTKKILTSILVMLSTVLLFSACKKKTDDAAIPLDPINGYNNSDEVGATSLVAKWSFDGTLAESKQSLAGTGTNTAFGTGIKGQCYQGSSAQARYAIYPSGTTIPALSSYSFGFWMNSDSMKMPLASPTQGYGAQGIFALANVADFWGGINLFLENRGSNDGDTLKLKMFVNNKRAGVVWQGQSPIFRIPGALNKWVHIVLTYDATTAIFTAYANGVIGGTRSIEGPYGLYVSTGVSSGRFNGTLTQYANDPGQPTSTSQNPNGAPLYGAITLPASSQMVIGAHQFNTTPALNTGGTPQSWATNFAGLLDELRIYNKALNSTEVNSLFQLETAGR
jgi:Concanavalin A-like lectin/glucanases superfamily